MVSRRLRDTHLLAKGSFLDAQSLAHRMWMCDQAKVWGCERSRVQGTGYLGFASGCATRQRCGSKSRSVPQHPAWGRVDGDVEFKVARGVRGAVIGAP